MLVCDCHCIFIYNTGPHLYDMLQKMKTFTVIVIFSVCRYESLPHQWRISCREDGGVPIVRWCGRWRGWAPCPSAIALASTNPCTTPTTSTILRAWNAGWWTVRVECGVVEGRAVVEGRGALQFHRPCHQGIGGLREALAVCSVVASVVVVGKNA